MSLEKMAALPIKIEIEGKEYLLAPLRLGSLAEFSLYFKQRELAELHELAKSSNIEKSMIAQEQSVIIRKTTQAVFEQYALTNDGLQFILWARMQKNHPNITLKDVSDFPITVVQTYADKILELVEEEEQGKNAQRAKEKENQ